MKEKVLALAEELDGVSFKENCDQCLACGTALCRGDLECAESAHKACAKRLREIVERDECEVTTVSAYDLLPDEDRKAIAWVREMGGVDEVERRLMPDGVEWPKVDGKPVDFGTGYEPSLGVLEAVVIYNNGACEVMSHDGIIKNVTEIHAVKPKVLDADGVPIHEGDTVWRVNGDGPFTATEYRKPWMCAKSEDGHVVGYWPDDLTHAKPEPPDSWERIEDDARLMPSEYTDRYRVGRIGFEGEDMRVDLVRRCRALAERERGE